MEIRGISKSTLTRLPVYLDYLRTLPASGDARISAGAIAAALELGEIQVRKDLACVSTAGRPKLGYLVPALIRDLEDFLGQNSATPAIVVGVGGVGRSLLEYEGFAAYGIELAAGFDVAPRESRVGGKPVYSMDRLADYCRENGVRLGVLAVPASAAQEVCDRMVRCGIQAILNLAPVPLHVPEGVLVHGENLAVSLAMLADHLERQQAEM